MGQTLTLTSTSPEDTERIGARLLALMPDCGVIALYGDLAAGKTCLVRGMAAAAHCDVPVTSPTFTIVNEYHGDRTIYHLDLYRLGDPIEIIDLGYEELFEPEDGITLVEWAERAEALLPPRRLEVRLEHAGADARRIQITDHGLLNAALSELTAS